MIFDGFGLLHCLLFDLPILKGLTNLWTQLIPCTISLHGVNMVYSFAFFDSLKKSILESFSVLLLHSIIPMLHGGFFFSPPVLLGWLVGLSAAYLSYQGGEMICFQFSSRTIRQWAFNIKANFSSMTLQTFRKMLSEVRSATKKTSGPFLVLFIIIGIFLLFGFYFFTSSIEMPGKLLNASQMHESCAMIESSRDDFRTNLKKVRIQKSAVGKQFTFVDHVDGTLFVECPGNLYVLGPQILGSVDPDWRPLDLKNNNDSIKYLQKDSSTLRSVSWDLLLHSNEPYAWLKCDVFTDFNIVVRPPTERYKENRPPLTEKQIEELDNSILRYSIPLGVQKSETVIDTVLLVYFDSVSRAKFQLVFKETQSLIKILQRDNIGSHRVFALKKLHALGFNSLPNYGPFFSGVNPAEVWNYFTNKTDTRNPKREVWLNDVAEHMGFSTLSLYGACHEPCQENCLERFKLWENIEEGGFQRQYMQETQNRAPADFMWPSSLHCESAYRSEVTSRKKKWVDSRMAQYVIANRMATFSYFDWFKTWLASQNKATPASFSSDFSQPQNSTNKRFGMLILEDTHNNIFDVQWDEDLAKLINDIFIERINDFGTAKTAMILLSDHGFHFRDEFTEGVGKIMNKEPFGFMFLPRTFLKNDPLQAHNIEKNSAKLITPLDLRTTILNWLTGRDWSAAALSSVSRSDLPFGSKHANSLMGSNINSNRTCADAGIPASFCGCNKFPCSVNVLRLVATSFSQIADFINAKFSSQESAVQKVCVPLRGEEFQLIHGGIDCITDQSGMVDVNLSIKYSTIIISATLHFESSGMAKVIDAHTATRYEPTWKSCLELFDKLHIQQNIAHHDYQYCYCEQRKLSWEVLLEEIQGLIPLFT